MAADGAVDGRALHADVLRKIICERAAQEDAAVASSAAKRQRVNETDDDWNALVLKSRDALTKTIADKATSSDWREEAVRRWGRRVPPMDAIADWRRYVVSRLATPPPLSPNDIMQERYAADPWRLLSACCLMSRISSERVKQEATGKFFQLLGAA
eukprot:TRINITY_DN20967_c0_g1_i1.p1 TRINITY_DN20967_c0_g1~~TRINITY_DN20967_c0_g1_i1.p1  ORF type:complete len:156 (-),score=32.27 TRINITY_DN20967_c0_g1_i1:320-787(-)